MRVDLLVYDAAQLVTCASANGPKRRGEMANVGLILDGAVAVADGEIVAVGPTSDVRAEYSARHTVDASSKVVCPGFVDPHTHVVYAGDRVAEFEMRIQGATYMEIMGAGGGIVSTTEATRGARVEELVGTSRPRLDTMLALGTTTVEVKTGYGLDTQSELKMLQAIDALDAAHPTDLVPTFLGAHAWLSTKCCPRWPNGTASRGLSRAAYPSFATCSARRTSSIGTSQDVCWKQACRTGCQPRSTPMNSKR
jgi:imidazolonepropionase